LANASIRPSTSITAIEAAQIGIVEEAERRVSGEQAFLRPHASYTSV
jgi:hypothetical protein